MRLVVDTNVFVSGGFKEASVPAIAVQMAAHHGQLLKSAATESELLTVLKRPKLAALIDPLYVEWVQHNLDRAETVSVSGAVMGCRDPRDDMFLDLALHGAADLIITGDAALLEMNPFHSTLVVTPAVFIKVHLLR